MARLARPIARALEDFIDANWPALETLNPREIADHVNALHLPALAGQPATPSNVRAAAAALGKALGKPAPHDPAQTRLLVDNLVALANALEARANRHDNRLTAAETSAADRWQAILAAGGRIAKRLEALEAAAGIEPPAPGPAD